MILEFKNSSYLESEVEFIKSLTRNSIRIHPVKANEPIGVGKSKFGGTPDLPSDVPWPQVKIEIENQTKNFKETHPCELELPENNTISLPFISQINLLEVSNLDKDSLLPSKGILYFFYNDYIHVNDGESSIDYVEKYYGNDWMKTYEEMNLPQDEIEKIHKSINKKLASFAQQQYIKVIYWGGDISALNRTKFPDNLPNDSYKYGEAELIFSNEATYPDCYKFKHFSGVQRSAYTDIQYKNRMNKNIYHMLGYPDLGSHEIDINKYVLLQIAGCDNELKELTGMFFCRGAFFVISKYDLLSRNFDNVKFDSE